MFSANTFGNSQEQLSLQDQELLERLGWFIRLRWLAATGVLFVTLGSRVIFDQPYPLWPGISVAAAIFIYNLLFVVYHRTRCCRQLPVVAFPLRLFANVQVITDLLALGALVYFLRAVDTYVLAFFFFHMIIASILLPKFNSYLLAVFASFLVNVLIWAEYSGILPHIEYDAYSGATGQLDSFEHSLKTTALMTFSLFASVYFASSITSKLRKREHQLEQALDSTRRLEAEKSFFMHKASHELRSPLAAIQTYLNIMLSGQNRWSDQQKKMLKSIQGRLESMLTMVNDLLHLARLREGSKELPEQTPVNFQNVVRRSIELMEPTAETKGIALKISLSPATLSGHEESLGQVADNLISNAIKYTPEGGQVAIGLSKENNRVRFSVTDTGIGIGEEDQKRLFEEFFRASNAKEMTVSGTGLGLSITKKIVEMHGGKIRLESRLGEGTKVEVQLPAVD